MLFKTLAQSFPQVKIMWPRGDGTSGVGADITSSRKSKSAGLSGFVQYMKRKDAEACVREMDGFDWGGSILRVGWSKAVPLAPRAMYGMFVRLYSSAHFTMSDRTIQFLDRTRAFKESRQRRSKTSSTLTLSFAISVAVSFSLPSSR